MERPAPSAEAAVPAGATAEAPAEAPAGAPAEASWDDDKMHKVVRKVALGLESVISQVLSQMDVAAEYAVFKVDVRGARPSADGVLSYGTWTVRGPIFGTELERLKVSMSELGERLAHPVPTALYLAVDVFDGDRPYYQTVPRFLNVVCPTQVHFEVPGDKRPSGKGNCDCENCAAPRRPGAPSGAPEEPQTPSGGSGTAEMLGLLSGLAERQSALREQRMQQYQLMAALAQYEASIVQKQAALARQEAAIVELEAKAAASAAGGGTPPPAEEGGAPEGAQTE